MKTLLALALTIFPALSHAIEAVDYSSQVATRLTIAIPATTAFVSIASVMSVDDINHQRIILAAREDAQYFLATEGQYKSGRLQEALNIIHSLKSEITEMQAIEAIAAIELK